MLTETLKPLQLIIKDPSQLQLLGAHLQDALISLTSMVYDAQQSTFQLLANRFCWEHDSLDHEGKPLYHRVHSQLYFKNIKGVYHRGFNLTGETRVLNLLTIQPRSNGHGGGELVLIYSGGGELRLEFEDLHCQLGDVGHPWPTHTHPQHLYEHLEELSQTP